MTLLDTDLPVVAAPMAGGPTTPALVLAAVSAGSLGFLAGGYRTADDLAGQIARVGASTDRFGVNLFAPTPVPVDPAAYAARRDRLAPLAERLGVELPAEPREDDDQWRAKVDVLVATPPPLVSFTFGLPDRDSVAALRRAGCMLLQTVTSVDEAALAVEEGLDALVVQSAAAGGHYGMLDPRAPASTLALPDLVRAVRAQTDLPLIAGGGVADTSGVRAALAAGATAVAVGTLLLRTPEAGTSAAYRSALAEDRGDPVVTRAFSGRPARGLPNDFIRTYDGGAPLGYPAIHHLTSPIRRAAAAAGDPEWINLWAGTGYRSGTDLPAADVLRSLSP